MKKILFIINVDWYFDLHWLDRANYFKSKGYHISIATKFTSKSIKDSYLSQGFDCYELDLNRKSINPFKEIFTLFSISRVINLVNPDLIHCVTIKPNIYTGLIHKKTPIVFSVTGLGAVFSSSKLKFRLVRKLILFLYKIVGSNQKSMFIFENNDDYLLLKNDGAITENGVVIKGAGINLDKFYLSPVPHNRIVLFAARLLRDKGLSDLVDAKLLLEKQNVSLTIQVAGLIDSDVSSAIPVSEIEEMHRDGLIEWLGSVEDMPSLIQNSDIVCLPTRYGEGVPRILIEAAACGRAIVATDVSGCREIVEIGSNGELVLPGDINELAAALSKLFNNPDLLETYGKAGRLKVKNEFSQEKVMNETFEVYKQLGC